jgi:hypothetical protein
VTEVSRNRYSSQLTEDPAVVQQAFLSHLGTFPSAGCRVLAPRSRDSNATKTQERPHAGRAKAVYIARDGACAVP